ncbi:MAG TPA: DEAD/DEAH box helicase, partial [Acidimicrobiales bacterium]
MAAETPSTAGGEDTPSVVSAALARVTGHLPDGGEARPGQVQMAEAVGRAVQQRRHLIVQAGTGTGKSLAYLVPLVLAGVKCVVATATKALQDQLADHDLPLLADHLGVEVDFSVLKGRSNYLCLQK